MNKSLPIICLCLVFTALLSCNRPDLTDEIWNAYHSVSKDSDDSGSECVYGDYTCRYGDSYYCRYDGSWEYYETCDYGCSYSTGRCDNGGSDGGYEYCGNHFIDLEYNEVCDGGVQECKVLDASFDGGFAYCKPDCSGYDTSTCVSGGNNGYDDGNDYSDTEDNGDTAEDMGDTYSEDYCQEIEGYTWSSKVEYMDWQSALDYCENLDKCGYSDWRLPSISELRLLIQNCSMTEIYGDCGVSDDCLEESSCWNDTCGGCEGDGSGYYSKLGDDGWFWSSSLQSDDSNKAWGVGFFNGLLGTGDIGFSDYVRCVR